MGIQDTLDLCQLVFFAIDASTARMSEHLKDHSLLTFTSYRTPPDCVSYREGKHLADSLGVPVFELSSQFKGKDTFCEAELFYCDELYEAFDLLMEDIKRHVDRS